MTGDYEVPPQNPAPPGGATGAEGSGSEGQVGGAGWPPAGHGPPVVPPDDPGAALWGPAAPPTDGDRWAPTPVGPTGGTALLDRPTTARRPLVAPPVRPVPAGPAAQSWEWEGTHRLRNALLAAIAILLVGSLIAALIIFRNRGDDKNQAQLPPPSTVLVPPATPAPTSTTAPPAPVVPDTAAPTTTAVPVTLPPVTAAPATLPAIPTTTATTRTTAPPATPSPPGSYVPPPTRSTTSSR